MKQTLLAATFYVTVAIVMTWRVGAGLPQHLPGDLGDPAFVSAVVAWGPVHWPELLSELK